MRVVAFDKTGTLTEGRPQLVAAEPAPDAGLTREALLALAAALQAGSEHPLARAVLAAASAPWPPAARRARPARPRRRRHASAAARCGSAARG